MKRLLFLAVTTMIIGFTKMDAANPGVDCDLLADITANLMINAGFEDQQIIDATHNAFWNCIGNGGSSNRL